MQNQHFIIQYLKNNFDHNDTELQKCKVVQPQQNFR